MNDTANMFRVLSTRRTALSLTALLAIGGVTRAETLQDPTRPSTVPVAAQNPAAGALQLEAIMESGTRRIAIINGRIVRAGDRIGTALIEEIGSDSVRYTRNGRSEISRIVKTKVQVRRTDTQQGDES